MHGGSSKAWHRQSLVCAWTEETCKLNTTMHDDSSFVAEL